MHELHLSKFETNRSKQPHQHLSTATLWQFGTKSPKFKYHAFKIDDNLLISLKGLEKCNFLSLQILYASIYTRIEDTTT